MKAEQLEELAENLWQNRRQDARVWEPLAVALIASSEAVSPQDQDKALAQGYANLAHALIHQAKGDFDDAHVAIDGALQAFEQSDELLWQARSHMVSGFLQVNLNRFKEALEDWKRAYDVGQIAGDRDLIITSLYSIAILNRVNLQRYEDAIGYFNRVLKLCMETDPPYVLTGNVYSGLSKCHMALDHKGLAERYAMQALEFAELYGDKRTLGWSLELCVTTYITLGDYEKAYHYAKDNLNTWLRIEDAYGLSIAYQDMAAVHRLRGNLQAALENGQRALEFAKAMKSQLVLESLYMELANLAEALGNYESSLTYYKAYMEIRENALKASFNQEISKVAGELKLENYRLKHVELEEKMRALKKAQDALVRSEKMNALLGLVGGVAHEINTPLGNSMTLNSYILDQCEDLLRKSSKQMLKYNDFIDYLDTAMQAQRGIEKGLTTVAHIVESFKRIAVNPSIIQIQRVNTLEFLRGWVNGLKMYYPQYVANIHIQCDPDHEGQIDVVETMKILDELFVNAMDHGYGPPYSGDYPLVITASGPSPGTGPSPSPSPSLGHPGGPPFPNLTLTFQDFGRGIEPEILQKIFEPFVKKGSSTSNLGIGLHVVYNVVVYVLEGNILVESEVGTGTRVSIHLPQYP